MTLGTYTPVQNPGEFSMLPAAGGYVIPHTDERSKIVTIVVSMMQDGEWDPAYGGGTDVNRPKDITRNFNWMNAQGRVRRDGGRTSTASTSPPTRR